MAVVTIGLLLMGSTPLAAPGNCQPVLEVMSKVFATRRTCEVLPDGSQILSSSAQALPNLRVIAEVGRRERPIEREDSAELF
jgi:hypothetical protein